jgi:sodium-coupled neutral amino acid transporter 11
MSQVCKDLGFVLELTGGFAATFLGFILPAACWLKLEGGTIFECKTLEDGQKMGSIFLLIFGIFTMFTSTGLTLMKAAEGK